MIFSEGFVDPCDDLIFMKPSPQISDETSGFGRSHSLESDSIDCFNLNVYEFPEGDEPYGTRSKSYQKPKQMWMAKDQALTNVKHSPTATQSTSFGGGSIADSDANLSETSNQALYRPSPTTSHPQNSPTLASTPGFTAPLTSCMSLCDQTPLVSETELNMSGTASAHMSPKSDGPNNSSVIKPDRSIRPFDIVSLCKPIEQGHDPRKIDSTGNKNKSRKKSALNNKVVSDEDQSTHYSREDSRRKRRCRSSRKNTVVSSGKNKSDRKHSGLTLTVSLSSIPNLNLACDTKNSAISSESSVNELSSHESFDQSSKSPKSLPSTSPFVSTGLKIRLRRDSAPIDLQVGRGKRAKSRSSSSTFRIVESWCDTDAPGGDFSRRARAASGTSGSPSFSLSSGGLRVGDIVWAKLAGYPYWPSQISAIWARTAHQLSQATLLPNSQPFDNGAPVSLAVLATPSDPSLAAGYTARVDWLAWDQCSYLSCAKLYPFKEAFDKLYSPRTRVKGYAEAVRLAKNYVNGVHPISDAEPQAIALSPQNKTSSTHSGHLSAPPSTDSQWSAMTTLSSLELSGGPSHKDIPEKNNQCFTFSLPSDTASSFALTEQPTADSQNKPLPLGNLNLTSSLPSPCNRLEDRSQPSDSQDCGNVHMWAPLPQLDISGLGDFVYHVPTFSEDEEEFEESLTSHLQIDFGSCM